MCGNICADMVLCVTVFVACVRVQVDRAVDDRGAHGGAQVEGSTQEQGALGLSLAAKTPDSAKVCYSVQSRRCWAHPAT